MPTSTKSPVAATAKPAAPAKAVAAKPSPVKPSPAKPAAKSAQSTKSAQAPKAAPQSAGAKAPVDQKTSDTRSASTAATKPAAPKPAARKASAPKTSAPKASAPKASAPTKAAHAPATSAAKAAAPAPAMKGPAATPAPSPAAPHSAAPHPAPAANSAGSERKSTEAKPAPVEVRAARPADPVGKPVAPAKPAPVVSIVRMGDEAAKASTSAARTFTASAKIPGPVEMATSITAGFVPGAALPKAMQDLAATGLNQARDAYQKARTSAETLTSSVGSSGEAVARGIQEFSRTLIDALQANTDATLGFMKSMAGVRSVSEAVELQARHARSHFEAVTEQAKALAGIANRTVSETTAPVRKAFDGSEKGST